MVKKGHDEFTTVPFIPGLYLLDNVVASHFPEKLK